jgi:hypothetical protein
VEDGSSKNVHCPRAQSIHHPAQSIELATVDRATRRHRMTFQIKWKLLHIVSLHRPIQLILCRPLLGKALVGKVGTQMQDFRMANSAKQIVDGRPHKQAWTIVQPYLPAMPHTSGVGLGHDRPMSLLQVRLAGVAGMA